MKLLLLSPTNPTRLGIVLNYSIFLYEILHHPMEAMIVAKKGFEEAVEELDLLNDDVGSFNDSVIVMELLRDNLQLWVQGFDEEEE